MDTLTYKEAVRKSFSKAAPTYDRYASIQQEVARRLLKTMPADDFHNILEVGCGTGNYSLLLRSCFPRASITAVDFSSEMLEVARGKLKGRVRFLHEDAEILKSPEKFDLITSNATFQWFEDLKKALCSCRDSLREGGRIHFSLFGPSTFCELKETLKRTYPRLAIQFPAERFHSLDRIGQALRQSFSAIKTDEVIINKEYRSLTNLLKTIKYTGVNGSAPGRGLFLTPARMKELEENYLGHYGKVRVTYQIFICRGSR